MNYLGIDIGSNSVGSAWVNPDKRQIFMGSSVFPSGVEESDDKRGAPKNKARRDDRGQRKSLARSAIAKAKLRKFLMEIGMMPLEADQILHWETGENNNPWLLRKKALYEQLNPYEFGRILLHMLNGRGAWWSDILEDEDEESEGISDDDKVLKEKARTTKQLIKDTGSQTYGEFMALKYEERRVKNNNKETYRRARIRNRSNALGEIEYEFCADRSMILQEFMKLLEKQKKYKCELSTKLTKNNLEKLYNPQRTRTWKCQGLIFGQHNTYWKVNTLGRCDLEPTDRCCPKCDMYAQEFLVLQDVNNIRITPLGENQRQLTKEERQKVISKLCEQKTAKSETIRSALKLNKKDDFIRYYFSTDNMNSICTNWFYREVIIGAIGEEFWAKLDEKTRDTINTAIVKLDSESEKDRQKFKQGCSQWWDLNEQQTETLYQVWMKKPKVTNRINFSQKAVRNLLPYLREGYTVTEARQMFAEDATNGASEIQRKRYAINVSYPNKKTRHFIEKHPDLLPPAPKEISNPVVRKAINEVRRHIVEHIRQQGKKPDRIVIELTREARQTAKVINNKINKDAAINRYKDILKKRFPKYFENKSQVQQERILERLRLCYQQREACPYCNRHISPTEVVQGNNLQVDHIIPRSRGGHNGLSNKVLCHVVCNQGKKNQTPQEWLSKEQFELMEQKFEHLKAKQSIDKSNFDMLDRKKWDNLHSEIKDINGFTESQLQATGYAATQIMNWIKEVLYDGDMGMQRHVYATKGQYTGMLRNDWGLNFNSKAGDQEQKKKDRSDHRHHAVDAVVIAMTGPERIKEVAEVWEKFEMDKDEKPTWNKREPIPAPWGDSTDFHNQVRQLYDDMIVSHKLQKRKLAGALHKDSLFGYIPESPDKYVKSISGVNIDPNHLRVPDEWEILREKLEKCHSETDKKILRRQMLSTKDVKPAKSGIVRDRWLREEIRNCLRKNNIDPNNFKPLEIKSLIKNGKFIINGIHLRKVRILWAKNEVVHIARKRYNASTGKKELLPIINEADKKAIRVYETQNNHHIEIRENEKGKWTGNVVTNFDAARRLKPAKSSNLKPVSAVDRIDNKDGQFIMSLSIGEMVKMKHPETQEPGYFVVFKIDSPNTIHFTPHNDAGRAKETDKTPKREDISLSSAQFKLFGVENGKPPVKVWVSPLGKVKEIFKD